MDVIGSWTMSLTASETQQAIQICGKLHHYAEDWSWTSYIKLLFLGQHNRWKLYSEVGEQDHVLHRVGVRTVSVDMWQANCVRLSVDVCAMEHCRASISVLFLLSLNSNMCLLFLIHHSKIMNNELNFFIPFSFNYFLHDLNLCKWHVFENVSFLS